MKPTYEFPIHFNILIDGVVRSRHSVRNTYERQEVIDANLRVYGSDHVGVDDDAVATRRCAILNRVIEAAQPNYPFLDEKLALEFCETLPIIPADKPGCSGVEWAEGMIEMLCNRWDRHLEQVAKAGS